ncbi:MutS-related protein [Acidiphilium sp.]|uniref:MutS-related protein n=1 Tax=Acidiphilium sp. TaxID=527 RepID=UPI003D01433C
MKAHLMFPDRDIDIKAALPPNAADLIQDMELETLLAAMAAGDKFLHEIAHRSVLTGFGNTKEIILWRQDVLQDCIDQEAEIRTLYAIALAPREVRKGIFYSFSSRYPGMLLSGAVRLLEGLRRIIGDLAQFATRNRERFRSTALRNLCSMLESELDPDYLATVDEHLTTLHFRQGVLFSARLGPGNEGHDYVLRHFVPERWAWLKDLINGAPPNYYFSIHPRDESGARALTSLRDEALVDAARTTSRASDHINDFFTMLRTELAFYIGCLNLRRALSDKGCPICIPAVAKPDDAGVAFDDLRDPCLTLTIESKVVGNSIDAPTSPLLMITGANQGGKSTFLRSLGLAQIMLQTGMFVTAQQFSAGLRDGLFTHYRRREDTGLNSGKFDEELCRMSRLADQMSSAPMFLFNESFAATNEREGSEIAQQIILALVEAGARIVFVTHMFALAESFIDHPQIGVTFLRAERDEGGTRSFRLLPGAPLTTSFGQDLYRQIFGNDTTH